MGVVWRAVHEESGATVALKTVRLLHPRQLEGLRREIRALSRVHHPGIARILEQGVHQGAPWYAMELVQGDSLRHRARAMTSTATTRFMLSNFDPVTVAGTLPIDDDDPLSGDEVADTEEAPLAQRPAAAHGQLQPMLTLVRRLCEPLAFLHGEGIVHRDLKPENVMILGDGRPVIVDFGLVSEGAAGREVLSLDAMLHGTVSYMSPEQIRGELVDARSDLYALGVILYELITGRLPFRSPSVGSALYQTLQRAPMAPSARVDGVAPELDALVLSLLEKRPEDRPGYATEVADALERMGAQPPETSGPPARPYLYRATLAGRREALDALRDCLDVRRGVALIGGESGVGKTRLVLELARIATARGRVVLVGECTPTEPEARGSTGSPLYPLRQPLQAVADRCLHDGADATRRILGDRGAVLARYQPALLDVPGLSGSPEPERLDPTAERIRTLEWLTETLVAAGGAHGTVLLLDDLQWADHLTVAWLAHLGRTDPPGLVVVGTWRADGASSPLSEVLEQPGVTALEVNRLDRAGIASMIGDMLALRAVPDALVDQIHRASAGNPFLVAEYLRAGVGAGVVQRRRYQWTLHGDPAAWAELPPPERFADLVRQRARRLGPLAAAGVAAAAVAGRELESELVAGIAGATVEDAWLDALSELVEAQLLEPHDGRLRFVHDQVRDVVYHDLPAAHRAALHRDVATRLSARRGVDPVAIAHHWDRGGDRDRARAWFLTGAQAALGQFALDDAARLLGEVLRRCDDPRPDAVRARIALGQQVLLPLGRTAEAMEALEQARDEARSLGDPDVLADAIGALATVAEAVGRLEDALALCMEELALRRERESAAAAETMLRIADLQGLLGRPGAATALADEALAIARASRDPVQEGRALITLAALVPDDPHRAVGLLSAARSRLSTTRARVLQATVLERLAGLADDAAAINLLGEASALYRAIGDRVRAASALTALAAVHHRLGRATESHAELADAIHIFRETGHHRGQGRALHTLGVHLRREGRLAEAEGLNRQALTILAVIGDPLESLGVRRELARIALYRQQPQRARQLAERALELARSLEAPRELVESLHVAGVAAFDEGDLDRAEALHGEAAAVGTACDPALVARAEVWLASIARVRGTSDPGALDARLASALERLASPRWHVTRVVAWCERGHLALAAGGSVDDALMHARDAHHEPLFLDPLAASRVAALEARRPRGT